jgi:hypothetical protein
VRKPTSSETSGSKPTSTVQVQARYISEAPLYFSKGTQDIDPKRGLEINGPSDKIAGSFQTIRIGIVSTAEGIQSVLDWCNFVNDHSIKSSVEQVFTSQTFPGFAKVFNARLVVSDDYNERISTREAELLLQTTNPNLRIRKAADLYASKVENICRRVTVPDVIICHESDEIERNCGLGVASQKREQGELRRKSESWLQIFGRRSKLMTYSLHSTRTHSIYWIWRLTKTSGRTSNRDVSSSIHQRRYLHKAHLPR